MLWKKICRGDVSEFERFYRDTAPRLLSYLSRSVGNRQTAEDILQETFMQLWSRPTAFHPDRGTLRGYLYGIARNRAADWWRHQKLTGHAPENRSVSSQIDTVSIQDALGHLPEELRTLLWLREIEGQSYAQLAVILEIPIGTVRSRLFAAREQLRRVWRGAPCGASEVL